MYDALLDRTQQSLVESLKTVYQLNTLCHEQLNLSIAKTSISLNE